MPAEYFLVLNLVILGLQACSLFTNSFILGLFYISRRLRKIESLRLLCLLALSDCLFAVTSVPYIVNYIKDWNPYQFDYDATAVIVSSLPLTIQFKLHLAISVAIGIDRIQAMRYPLYYRGKSHMKYVMLTACLGIAWGIVDCIIEVQTSEFDIHRIGCAAVGCFQHHSFKLYWSITNGFFVFSLIILTIWVAIQFHSNVKTMPRNRSVEKERIAQMEFQANRLSFGLLLVSTFFLMIPSTLIGLFELIDVPLFRLVGPFYMLGLLLAGILNSILYITLHVELRREALRLFQKKGTLFDAPSLLTVPTLTSQAIFPK